MLRQSFFRTGMLAFLAACTLIACGGGGGGSSTGNAVVAETPWVAPTGPAATVTGVVQYERVGQLNTGALNYNSITTLPIRGATVELIYQGRSVATTQSNASGQYTITTAPAGNIYSIRIKSELKQAANQWNVTVGDNTAGGALYAVDSVNFSVSTTGATRNVTAGSGWVGTPSAGSYAQPRSAGPFAILDTIYASQQKVLSAQANAIFPRLEVFWSVQNNTATGNDALGDIGGSFFRTTRDANGAITARSIYILGRENNDTDEYDDSVIAHEWGHYYQSAFSRDNSMGGSHSTGDDRLDRRIAFSEGWGNGWSGMVTGKAFYGDSEGSRQASAFSFSFPLNSGYNTNSGGSKGWFREFSIQYILYSLHVGEGFKGIHDTLTSNTFRNGSALTDIHLFSHAYRTRQAVTTTAALDQLLTLESISITNDAYGSNETNNGGNANTLPYYRQLNANGTVATAGQTICTFPPPSGASANKLGYFAYARVTLAASSSARTITVTGSNASADVDFQLFKDGQLVYIAQADGTLPESKTQALAAGEYIIVIYDYAKVGNVCHTVSIQ